MTALAGWENFYVIVGSSAVSAYVALSHARPALFLVGAATLLFLFVGIHNHGTPSRTTSLGNGDSRNAERHRWEAITVVSRG